MLFALTAPSRLLALERICDSAFEDCRSPLLALIEAETVGIDVGFWFMEDGRYSAALIRRFQAGVPVRVVFDSEAVGSTGPRRDILNALVAAGIPLRDKTSGGIVHWKMMLFAGQNTVEFSGANYSPFAFVPNVPYADYMDEIIYFTDRPALVNSFKSRFDDVWTASSGYSNYANVPTPVTRTYPTYSIASELNFVPWQNFATRSVSRYNAETQQIDTIIYRINDRRHTDAIIAAHSRGVRVRLITEQDEYRSPERLWHAWNVDRLFAAGIEVKLRAHAGLTHEKLTLLHGQRMAVFGSSNWTRASANSHLEHNLFTNDATFFAWSTSHFERKWSNLGPSPETKPFTPLPPDRPQPQSPSNGSVGNSANVTLSWYAGLWAHKYDVYLGTSPSDLQLVLADAELGPSESSNDHIKFQIAGLAANTTYYWAVVSRTMANQSAASALWSFSTGALPFNHALSLWDVDGDGESDPTVWRPGNGTWYLRQSGTPGAAVPWGTGSLSDIPVPGDYDGDGRSDPAVWRPGSGMWFVLTSKSSFRESLAVQWGSRSYGDIPVPGDYDGDGKTDLAVWRPASGMWYVL
jgi:hypothetical protein